MRLSLLAFLLSILLQVTVTKAMIPSWEELDRRLLPRWYAKAKFGIFLHWGVFSVPSFGSEWFQKYWQGQRKQDYQAFVNTTERPNFAYSEYASRFRAELYEPQKWAQAFAQAGAQYVVLTSKHHEGYCMWDSRDLPATWQWNVMDVGPRRDVLGELAKAIQNTTSPYTNQTMQFGVYHSLFEWFNPLYLADKANNFNTSLFVDTKITAELVDLVQKYQPTLIWSDGQWEAHSDYWKARQFLDWYSTQSPVASDAVWNDRWGTDTLCRHGSFLTCADNFHPKETPSRYWEKCLSVDQTSWGYNRRATLDDYLTTQELIHELVMTVAQNGNLLLNIGPASDGRLPTIFLDRLQDMGTWLQVNGPAIYGTSSWSVCTTEPHDHGIYYTFFKENGTVYVHVTTWPANQRLTLSCLAHTTPTMISMLGVSTRIGWKHNEQGDLEVQMPNLTPDRIPCQYSWVLAVVGTVATEAELVERHRLGSIH